MERLSDKEALIKEAKQLFFKGIELHCTNQSKAISNFKESAKIFESLQSKYYNNLELYFYLLEVYEGLNKDIAIQHGYKCLNILESKSNSKRQLGEVLTEYDVLRKLYKLLVKRGRAKEAEEHIYKLLAILEAVIPILPKANYPSSAQETLSREMQIADYFLQGIESGKDMSANLVDGFEFGSAELFYQLSNTKYFANY
ncbi:hypothetical protein CAL7716_101810 (plasmid) [Calothrix sp. PCC 7716]|nr:hypothetical protein CAL7716_101810 [Calothrix sp. PCC 7716]